MNQKSVDTLEDLTDTESNNTEESDVYSVHADSLKSVPTDEDVVEKVSILLKPKYQDSKDKVRKPLSNQRKQEQSNNTQKLSILVDINTNTGKVFDNNIQLLKRPESLLSAPI